MYDVLFYVYACAVAPFLAGAIRDALNTSALQLLPGLVILAAFVCETLALPILFARSGGTRTDDAPVVPLALGSAMGICHVILSYFLCFYMLDSFGVMGGPEELTRAQNWILAIAMGLVFARETYVFFATGAALRSRQLPSRGRQIAADVCLLVFQCVAYTTYWDTMFGSEAVRGLHWVATLFVAAGLVLVFYILYLPLRMADVLATYYTEGAAAGRRAARTMFVTGALLGVYPVLAGIALALAGR